MRRFALIPLLFVCMAGAASAADYPDHPIRFIVPQAAGSATDNVARILASVIGPELGQPVIVDDRPGGALTLGQAGGAHPQNARALVRRQRLPADAVGKKKFGAPCQSCSAPKVCGAVC